MRKIILPLLLSLPLTLAPSSVFSANPQKTPNNSWITLTGTVTSASADAFNLKYGKNSIKVEMDDWDWYPEGSRMLKGERVTVTGKMDDDLLERRSIEASSVYVPSLNSYFYASAADEEDAYYPYAVYWSMEPMPDFVSLTGTVQSISGREFVLDTGTRDITVDTEKMKYNPLDDQGYQKIDVGDRVRINGNIDVDLFERREIDATSILTLAGS